MSEEKMEIRFYRTKDRYGEFSNFAAFPITIDGTTWPTTEHYFQAQKFPDPVYREAIRAADSPMIAAKMGRDRGHPIRADWEAVKDDVMLEAVRTKFAQYEELRRLLLETGSAILIEHTKNDAYWADGGDGSGRNRLGEILMQVRKELAGEK